MHDERPPTTVVCGERVALSRRRRSPIVSRKLGATPRWLGVHGCRCGRRRPRRQCVRVQSRRAPDGRVRSRTAISCAPGAKAPSAGRMACTSRPTAASTAPTTAITRVRKCTPDGKVLLTIGVPGKPAPYFSGEPFHRCTHTALSPSRRHLRVRRLRQCARPQVRRARPAPVSWGEPGTDPGQFNLVHNICCRRRRLGLCRRSRKSSRAGVRRRRQVRGAMEQPAPALRPVHGQRGRTAVLHRRTRTDARFQSQLSQPGATPDHRRPQGRILARVGLPRAGLAPGQFVAPHGLAVDSHGDIYVGEVSYTAWSAVFPNARNRNAFARCRSSVKLLIQLPGPRSIIHAQILRRRNPAIQPQGPAGTQSAHRHRAEGVSRHRRRRELRRVASRP